MAEKVVCCGNAGKVAAKNDDVVHVDSVVAS